MGTTIADALPKFEWDEDIRIAYQDVTLSQLHRMKAGSSDADSDRNARREEADITARRYAGVRDRLALSVEGPTAESEYSNLGYVVAGVMNVPEFFFLPVSAHHWEPEVCPV